MHLGGLTDLPEEALMSRPAWRQQQKKPGVGRRETESVAAPTRDEGKRARSRTYGFLTKEEGHPAADDVEGLLLVR
jgi:hypothetical protein